MRKRKKKRKKKKKKKKGGGSKKKDPLNFLMEKHVVGWGQGGSIKKREKGKRRGRI